MPYGFGCHAGRMTRMRRCPGLAMVSLSYVLTASSIGWWGCLIPKGGYHQLRSAGLDQFRQSLAHVAPEWDDRVDDLQSWQQIVVLSIEASRLKRWYKPGLLLIGDAAHVMSPVGGAGINYAIQDAVAAANVLSLKLKQGVPVQERELAAVQKQREFPIRCIQ